MELTSSAIRGCICAPQGKKLVVAIYRTLKGAHLLGLQMKNWKIEAFYDFDAGKGHDLYKLAYAKSFGVLPEDVDKEQRQSGRFRS